MEVLGDVLLAHVRRAAKDSELAATSVAAAGEALRARTTSFAAAESLGAAIRAQYAAVNSLLPSPLGTAWPDAGRAGC